MMPIRRVLQIAFVSLCALSLALGWWVGIEKRQPGWALFWMVAVFFISAPLLALQMAWAGVLNQRPGSRKALGSDDEPAPAPGIAGLLWAWLMELPRTLQVYLWQQAFFSNRHADQLPAEGDASRGSRGMLLVHGYVCNRGFWNPWIEQLRGLGVPFIALELPSTFDDIASHADRVDEAVQRLTAACGQAPLLVGHSMGGLVLRAWRARHAPSAASAQMVTIGSPHHGTVLAQFANTTAAGQMRLLSPWLQQLADSEQAAGLSHERLTCYWSLHDHIVFPAQTATLPGARNILVPGRAHVDLAFDERVWSGVMSLLQAHPADSPLKAGAAATAVL